MQLLDITVTDADAWRVISLVGQLDVATAAQARHVLQEEQYEPATWVVLDLSQLEFLDSFGLGVLVGGLRRARTGGGRLAVAAAAPRILRVLEVTGLDAVFEVAGSLEEVVGG